MSVHIMKSPAVGVATSITELHSLLGTTRAGSNKTIALVPTMGSLHAGHARLIREARKLADIVVVSIYVNPLQFGPNEDFEHYPRNFEADAEVCAGEGADFIFHPASLYPEGGPKITLAVRDLGDVLCGAARPGHFDGVASVVAILFNAVQPDMAVFGEKDWQQLSIIRRMVADLHMPLEIIGVETVREADGLAMSSRNRYLNDAELEKGHALSAALNSMQLLAADGERNTSVLVAVGRGVLQEAGIEPEYLEIRQADSLHKMNILNGAPARAFVAAMIGPARLIDNLPLGNTLEKL